MSPTPRCKKKPLTVVGDGAADDRQKRERQISEGSENPAERKTVRIMSVPQVAGCPVDEPYGTTKLDFMRMPDGEIVCARRQSLSDNDKG